MVLHESLLKGNPEQSRGGNTPGLGHGRDQQTDKRALEGNLVDGGTSVVDHRAALMRRATLKAEHAATDRRNIEFQLEQESEKVTKRQSELAEQRKPQDTTHLDTGHEDLLTARSTPHPTRRATNIVRQSVPPLQSKPSLEVDESMSGTKAFLFGAGKLIGDATSFVVDKGAAAAKKVGQFAALAVTDPAAAVEKAKDAAIAVGDGITTAVEVCGKGLTVAASFVGEHGWKALKWCGELVASPIKGCFYFGQSLGEGILDVGSFLLGQKSWSEVAQNFSSNIGKAGAEFARPFHLVKSLSDSLGITDLVVGVGHVVAIVPHLLWDAGKILTGRGSFADLSSNFVSHLNGAKDGVLGGLRLLGEVTGVIDLFLACKHGCQAIVAYGRGDMTGVAIHTAQAVMHGTFAALSAGSIAATVATAGAAGGAIVGVALLRQSAKEATKVVLKEASKQFFKGAAKEIGEVALQKVAGNATEVLTNRFGAEAVLQAVEKHAGQELVQAVGKEAREAVVNKAVMKELLEREAREGAGDVLKEVARRGQTAISTEVFESVGKEIGEKRTVALLKELKLDAIVKDEVLPLLRSTTDSNPKKLASTLSEKFGLSKDEAKQMAKEVQRCLNKGRSDEEIKAILEEGISKPLTEKMAKEMEKPFKDTMRSGLKGEMPDVFGREMVEAVEKKAASLGKTVDSYVDELTEASWKGYREGIERAVKSVVREGIEKAFKEFRNTKYRGRLHGGLGDGMDVVSHDEKVIADVDFKAEGKKLAERDAGIRGSEEAAESTYITSDASGRLIRVRTRLNPTDNHLEVTVEPLEDTVRKHGEAA